MWRLSRAPARGHDDEGAVAVLVALLFGSGVLLGMAALTVDVGLIYAERRQVQNGADAAALAVALDCARADTCPSDVESTAIDLAGDNANDALTDVEAVCGDVDWSLTGCAENGNPALTRCSDPPEGVIGWVETRTRTAVPGGGGVLPPIFSGALAGEDEGTAVAACAQAAWGPPKSINGTLPVTISICEWSAAVGGEDSPTFPSGEVRLRLHDPDGGSGGGGKGNPGDGKKPTPSPTSPPPPNDTVDCPATAPGGDVPGGFGWLDGTNGCSADITAGGEVSADTGVAVPKDCKDVLPTLVGTVIYVPIYDALTGTGTGASYHIKGFAAFHLTGYSLPGATDEGGVSFKPLCKGDEKCLYGWFTTGLADAGGTIGDGPDLGVRIVALTG